MKIKYIVVAALAALTLGLAALIPDGQQVIAPAKTSPTAWAVMGGAPGGVVGSKGPHVSDGKGGVNGGDVRSHE
jgi:hypothetical protein